MSPIPPYKKPADFRLVYLVRLTLLLVVPAYAAWRLSPSIDWRILAGVPAAMSVFAFFTCRRDKRRAEASEWRTPESTLHLLELLGGWPGSFLAQRIYRHKTAKFPYQFVFWLIVFVYEFVAVDSLQGWKFSHQVMEFMDRHSRR